MKENWAKSLKQRMAGFRQPVDDALWAGIARVSVKAGIRWWPWVTAALACAAVISIVLLLQPEPVVEPIIVVGSGEIVATLEDNAPIPHRNRPIRLEQNNSVPTFIETEESFPPENVDEESVPQVEYSAKEESVNMGESMEDEWVRIIEEESAPRRNRVKITTSFYAQASPFGNRYSAGSIQVQEDKPEPPPGNTTPPDYPPGGGETGPIDGDPVLGDPGNDDDDNETKALSPSKKAAHTQSAAASPEWTHAFPIQIGARVSLSWSERWSIDTGLTFMHFYSWNASTRQRMEFLGIPLYVNYMIGSARNYSFYASAGGQAFKCFAGNAPDKPWLFSCGLGVGAEYNFSPLVSMYAEPGADWYFHTGESCHYYTDNPFAFSLSLGFRLHF